MKKKVIKTILHQIQDIYNIVAPDFSDTRGQWWIGFGDFAKYVKSGDKVLDLGCGNGRMAEIFKDSKIKYLGLDNSEELIKIARKRYKRQKGIRFKVGNIISLKLKVKSLKVNSFDLVLLIAVLHHIPTKKLQLKILQDIYQVLKPGGRLVVSNWNLWGNTYKGKFRRYLFNYKTKVKNGVWSFKDAFVPWKRGGHNSQRYIHSFTKGEMKWLLKKAGFKVEKIEYEKLGQKAGLFTSGNLLAVAVKK